MPLAKRKIEGEVQFCIPIDLWRCPKCGASPKTDKGGFVLDEPFDNGEHESKEISPEDEVQGWTRNATLYCYECEYTTTTAKFFAQLLKKKNTVPCPCCKGSGYVSDNKNKEQED
jgi:hypothetical protein